MNTQQMDDFLNRERLTDLAEFGVPDGHDLWPKIERASHRSAIDTAILRPGILSLGLSRAWTAVGLLFVAATFAILGLGLVILVLSNGHDQAPAAQPDTTVTPTPTKTATPPVIETIQPASSPGFEITPTGEDPAKSQALPDESETPEHAGRSATPDSKAHSNPRLWCRRLSPPPHLNRPPRLP